MPPSDFLKKFRQEILYNADEFKKIIQANDFKNTFEDLMDDKLKRPPKDFPADFPDVELLKYKSYIVSHQVDGKKITSPDFNEYVINTFAKLKSFNEFLNRALD